LRVTNTRSAAKVKLKQNAEIGRPFRPDLKAGHLKKVRVFLADDHPHVLARVKGLLEPSFDIVGTASDGQSLVDYAPGLNADVLVMDISMPMLTGIEAANQLKEAGCQSKIVFLTVHSDPDYVRACLATGASGYVVKARMSSDLERAIREAVVDHIFISPSLAGEA
jgi:DNA-binding NarL/FixJ family response regulator